MSKEEVISILEQHNRWRRDNYGEVEAVDTSVLGRALDEAIKYLKDE